ncbi:MAG: 50S ribosomal protein L3 [Victivallales bacterium]|nr:50S ribosomal protein L3 [Victivallales bacterium]
MKGLIGKKLGMTQVYSEQGILTPVTVIEAGPCVVVDVKTAEKDGYSALQLGYGRRKAKNVSKPVMGHFKRSGLENNPPAIVREFRLAEDPQAELGSEIKAEVFDGTEYLDITGITKGRGFQGVVKRWNFRGGRYSHGGGWKRKPGSIGCREWPAHVIKGKKLPGQMGNVQRTIQNLKLVQLRAEENLLFVKGAIPGPTGGIIMIKSARKKGN